LAWEFIFRFSLHSRRAAERILLDHAAVVSDADQPSFVQYGIDELVGYLKESTGNEIPVVASLEKSKRVQILVGAKSARQVFPETLPREKLGEEGCLLRSLSQDGAEFIIAAGANPHGTKAALAALMKTIQVEGPSAFVPAPLDRLESPAVARRGMHFNGWAFNAPYSFRNWREEWLY
jgi:alpha-glucuronidase